MTTSTLRHFIGGCWRIRPGSAGRADGEFLQAPGRRRIALRHELGAGPMSRTGRTTARRWCAHAGGRFEWRLPDAAANPPRHRRADRRRPGRHRPEDRPGPGRRRRSLEQPLVGAGARGIGVLPQSPAEAMDALEADAVRGAGRHAGASSSSPRGAASGSCPRATSASGRCSATAIASDVVHPVPWLSHLCLASGMALVGSCGPVQDPGAGVADLPARPAVWHRCRRDGRLR